MDEVTSALGVYVQAGDRKQGTVATVLEEPSAEHTRRLLRNTPSIERALA